MKPIKDYDKVQASGEFKKLPTGAYKLIILGVKYQDNSAKGYSDQLLIQYDIAEGEYKDFYQERFKNDTNEDKKYKGIYRLYVPKDDGSEQDNWTKSKFKRFTNAVEDSNAGYKWGWDESTLKGKFIGGIFNQKEWEKDGKTGFFTNLHSVIKVDDLETAIIPEPTYLQNKSTSDSSWNPTNGTGSDLDEIPFN